jgi:hypothetical protein
MRAVTRLALLLLAAALGCSVSCHRPCALRAIRDGDLSIVQRGSYRGRLRMITAGMDTAETAEQLRVMVDENSDVLDIVSDRFHAIEHLAYRFKYAAYDIEGDILVLRYFARIVDHPLYAGYQIQLVFHPNDQRLKQVYTEEVPLE